MANQQQVYQSYDELPEDLKTLLYSSNTSDLIDTISAENHVNEDGAKTIWKIVGMIILGLEHLDDLPSIIATNVGVDANAAQKIAQTIIEKILSPAADSLNKQHGFGLVASQPQVGLAHPTVNQGVQANTPSAVPLNQRPLSPRENQVTPKPATPFVIHEHTPVEKIASATDNRYEGGLVRPSFFTPPSRNTSNNEIAVARLEIGAPDTQEEIQTTRIGKESARVVHYSAPQAPADPFSAPPKMPQTKPAIEKKDIPQSNVVNLKDLPQ